MQNPYSSSSSPAPTAATTASSLLYLSSPRKRSLCRLFCIITVLLWWCFRSHVPRAGSGTSRRTEFIRREVERVVEGNDKSIFARWYVDSKKRAFSFDDIAPIRGDNDNNIKNDDDVDVDVDKGGKNGEISDSRNQEINIPTIFKSSANPFRYSSKDAEIAFDLYAKNFRTKHDQNQPINGKKMVPTRIQPMTAFLEPEHVTTIPNTGSTSPRTDAENKVKKSYVGTPPEFIVPLPLRKNSPNDLHPVTYPNVRTCHRDLPAQLPIDAGLILNPKTKEHVYPNVHQYDPPDPLEFSKYCPVDADPYLPWIHDVFPSTDGKVVHFVAQNRRRCHTGDAFEKTRNNLVSQVALMQPLSVERLTEEQARKLAPELWHPDDATNRDDENTSSLPRYRLAHPDESTIHETRFICRFHTLIPSNNDDPNDKTATQLKRIIIGETTSTYAWNPELVNLRKKGNQDPTMLTPRGHNGDNSAFWLSNYRFECPVPNTTTVIDGAATTTIIDNNSVGDDHLHRSIAAGSTVLHDGTPSIYVDVIPIRTPPRYGKEEVYPNLLEPGGGDMSPGKTIWGDIKNDYGKEDNDNFKNDRIGRMWLHPPELDKGSGEDKDDDESNDQDEETGFDPRWRWGSKQVLPRVEASGRWANIPICAPPRAVTTTVNNHHSSNGNDNDNDENSNNFNNPNNNGNDSNSINNIDSIVSKEANESKNENGKKKKTHTLAVCLWASSIFKTRGVGNNGREIGDTGERLREWIEFHLLVGFEHFYIYDNSGAHTHENFLVDYLSGFGPSEVTIIEWPARICNNNIPAHEDTGERSSQYAAESSCLQRYGPHTEWIGSFDTDEYIIPMGKHESMRDVVQAAGEKGTNVLSFRSTRAYPSYEFMRPFVDGHFCKEGSGSCLEKDPDALFLETYNCDFDPLPKPDWSIRAKKQLYRPDYVLSHFVHYSTVTRGILETRANKLAKNEHWRSKYSEPKESERFTNEVNEAVMLHTKTMRGRETKSFRTNCKFGFEERWDTQCKVGFPYPENNIVTNRGTVDGFKYNCFSIARLRDVFVPKLREAMTTRVKYAEDKSRVQF